jgi:peptidyl-prolyl cis-trans isomerase SurA
MKPGKKEKIRFGQAPRETLPTATTKTEDAGAGATSEGTQVAANVPANNVPSGMHTVNPDGSIATPDETEAPKQKTRFQDRAKQPKEKKAKGPKVDPFAPAPVTKDEVADQQQQGKALGLNGDTSKIKKPNPAKTGPKRRMTDEKKNGEQPATPNPPAEQAPAPAAGSDTGAAASAPAPAPAPPAAPATPNQ